MNILLVTMIYVKDIAIFINLTPIRIIVNSSSTFIKEFFGSDLIPRDLVHF